jgi:hypothetical protein
VNPGEPIAGGLADPVKKRALNLVDLLIQSKKGPSMMMSSFGIVILIPDLTINQS